MIYANCTNIHISEWLEISVVEKINKKRIATKIILYRISTNAIEYPLQIPTDDQPVAADKNTNIDWRENKAKWKIWQKTEQESCTS